MTDGALDGLYQEIILDHARAPHGYGLREKASAESHQINPTCGDEVTVRLHANAGDTQIESISWEGHGCAISQSSASVLSDLVHDLEPEELHARIAAFRTLMRSKGASTVSAAVAADDAAASAAEDDDLLGDAVVFAGVSRYVARIKCAMLPWVAVEDALSRFHTAA